MGRMKELWARRIDDIYQDYADGNLGRDEALDLLLELGLDLPSIEDGLDTIRDWRS